MTRHTAAALLVLAVLAAGCTQLPIQQDGDTGTDVTVTPSDGLSTSLEPSSTAIQDGDGMVVELAVQNTGQSDANVTWAVRYGASIFDGCTAGRTVSGSNPLRLNAALPDADQVGGQVRLQWTCDSVTTDLGSGESDSYPVGVETTYEYATTARTSFTVERQGDSAQPSGQRVSNTAAPVHAAIDVADPAVIDSGEETVSLPITVSNVGDGEVDGDVTLSVSTPQSRGQVTQCPSTATLLDGQRQVLCRISFTSGVPSTGTQVFVQVDLGYDYTERVETSITVTG